MRHPPKHTERMDDLDAALASLQACVDDLAALPQQQSKGLVQAEEEESQEHREEDVTEEEAAAAMVLEVLRASGLCPCEQGEEQGEEVVPTLGEEAAPLPLLEVVAAWIPPEGAVEARLSPAGDGPFGFSIIGGCDSDLGAVFIRAIQPDTPAAVCGAMGEGDEVLAVNGAPVEGLAYADVAVMIRAGKGRGMVLHLRPLSSLPRRDPAEVLREIMEGLNGESVAVSAAPSSPAERERAAEVRPAPVLRLSDHSLGSATVVDELSGGECVCD